MLLNATAHTVADNRIIPVSDPAIQNGISPYNWVTQNASLSSSVTGASLVIKFQKTNNVRLLLDVNHLATLSPERCPILAWSVNGWARQTYQLVAGESSVELASKTPNPVIDLYIQGMSPFEDRFAGDVPRNAVQITGFSVDANGFSETLPQPPNIWLNIGDSIMAGDGATYRENQGRPPDDAWAASDESRSSYGYLLAKHFGFRESRLAYGGYNWAGGAAGTPALAQLIQQKTSTIPRVANGLLAPVPIIVLINLGENGVPADATVSEALQSVRASVGPAAIIIVMIPVSGRGRAEITRAVQSYQDSIKDDHAFLVDLGPIKFATSDGQHPTAAGHETIYQAALEKISVIVNKLPNVNREQASK